MIKFFQLLLSQSSSLSAPITQHDPQSAKDYAAHLYLGNMYISLGQIDRAEEEYFRAHKIRPCPEIEGLIDSLRLRRASLKRSAQATSQVRVGRAA